ncbi:MAG TPA: hypothetical protein VN875_17500 [Candidatus Binatus sp.]|nr:hypothetical protein [Candidatus Binatus sp.]
MMSTAIIVAIVAFVSTTLGATIGAVTNYVLAVRRERSERDQDRRARAIEIKRAVRLIDLELVRAQALASMAIKKRYWVPNPDAELSTDAWQKHDGTIAPYLSDQAWNAVTVAFMAVEHIKGSRALYLAGPLRELPISDENAAGVDPMLKDVTLGREALASFAFNQEEIENDN